MFDNRHFRSIGFAAAVGAGFFLAVALTRASVVPETVLRFRETCLHEPVPVDCTVVRIVTMADFEGARTDGFRAFGGAFRNPLVAYGTGLIVDSLQVNGQQEYLIVSSHHVVDLNVYLSELRRQLADRGIDATSVTTGASRSYLVATGEGGLGDSVRVIPVAVDERSDVVLLRTVEAHRRMHVFSGDLGLESDVAPVGARVISAGFTIDGRFLTARGTITGVRDHDLGIPHVGYTLDVALSPGQSGSPVFLEREGRTVLIGILHARDGKNRYAVPYSIWKGLLCADAHRPRRRACS